MDPLVVGSSSTWTQEELDLFHVRVERDVDVREMIPEKFFDFSTLKNYHAGTAVVTIWYYLVVLIVARKKLVLVQRADLGKVNVLIDKAGWFSWAFSSLHKLLSFKKTDPRIDNLSQTRSEKHSHADSRPPISSMPSLVSQYPCRRLGPLHRRRRSQNDELSAYRTHCNQVRVPNYCIPVARRKLKTWATLSVKAP